MCLSLKGSLSSPTVPPTVGGWYHCFSRSTVIMEIMNLNVKHRVTESARTAPGMYTHTHEDVRERARARARERERETERDRENESVLVNPLNHF